MLSQGRVRVNGETCNLAARPVHSGDILEIGPRRAPARLPSGLEILFEDNDILIIQKHEGLLTVATADEREETAYFYLRQYLQQRNRRQRLFIVHRLDKFASGVLVFAKSDNVKSVLQGVFSRHEIQRKYWAIVEGNVEKDRGTIRSRLAEDKSLRMHSTTDETRGKSAVTHYRVLRRAGKVSALEVTLETGRKNQIRVHLADINCPVAGDKKYGAKTDPIKRIGLHAFYLAFTHPITGEAVVLTSPIPKIFTHLGSLPRS